MATIAHWLVALLVISGSIADAAAQVHVRGYFRKDGTYVAPHVRSSPNSSRSDNYSARGNYNPYTGKRGTVDPYRTPPERSYSYAPPVSRPVPAYSYPSVPAPAPASQLVPVWRCVDASGGAWYLAYPRAGCAEILVRQAPVARTPQVPALQSRQYFSGYPCTIDCSGHSAGYDWADENGIDDPDDCGGNSQSFIEGCEAYAGEQQAQMVEGGECDDEDEDGLCD